jgi:hypothetical protein
MRLGGAAQQYNYCSVSVAPARNHVDHISWKASKNMGAYVELRRCSHARTLDHWLVLSILDHMNFPAAIPIAILRTYRGVL